MRKALLLFFVAALAVTGRAADENIVQVKPCATYAGVDGEEYEEVIEIEMTNSFDVANLQFDLLLPEGMTYVDYDFDLTNSDIRVPYKKKGKNLNFYFSVSTNVLSSGYRRFMFVPQADDEGQLHKIEAGTGVFMQLYFSTSADMKDGIYPILMDNIKLVKSVSEGSIVTSSNAVSYVTVGKTSAATETDIDLSALTGYMPSFVVESLNSDLAANENLRSLDLSGVTSLGAELDIPEDVTYQVGTSGGLKRTYPAAQYSTVCLPFALTAEQVAAIKDGGCEIQQLSGYNASASTVAFEPVTEMAANTPYLVRSETSQGVFDGLDNVTLAGLKAETNAVAQGQMSMVGSFEKKTISSDSNVTYYAYDAADGSFVRIGSNATVKPFRAYLALIGTSNAPRMKISEGLATAVNRPNVANSVQKSKAYDLQGRPVLQGRSRTTAPRMMVSEGKKYVAK